MGKERSTRKERKNRKFWLHWIILLDKWVANILTCLIWSSKHNLEASCFVKREENSSSWYYNKKHNWRVIDYRCFCLKYPVTTLSNNSKELLIILPIKKNFHFSIMKMYSLPQLLLSYKHLSMPYDFQIKIE